MRLTFKLLSFLLLAIGLHAQTTRTVSLSWTASTSTGVTGYNLYRCTSPCTLTIPGTPLSTTAGLAIADATAAVGQTYIYGVTAFAPACTPTTPVSTPCGESAAVTATVPVPPKPTPPNGSLVVIVQ